MKSFITSLLLVICSITTYAQIEFEKGYYIDNDGNKIEGLIKNRDTEHNPSEFVFRQSEGAATQTITVENAKEFAIAGIARFVRAEVDIDFSILPPWVTNKISTEGRLNELSQNRAPEFQRKKVFLKILVQGKANLYVYVNSNQNISQKWFFVETDKVPVQQLINKVYAYNGGIAKNQTFRQQLIAAFECNTPERSVLEHAEYRQGDLVKLFNKYNTCMQSESVDFTISKVKRDAFNLWLRPRMNMSSLTASRLHWPPDDVPFGNQTKFSAGIEAEFILPFNRNTWAITIEPTFLSYDATTTYEPNANNSIEYTVEYNAFDLPIGIRHYFFLNNSSKLSLAAAFQMNFAMNSAMTEYHHDWELINSFNAAIEVGYVFKNKFSIAYRYQTDRTVLVYDNAYHGDFTTMGVVFGYSLF